MDQDKPATAKDLMVLGLSYPQVNYWVRMGWLRPDTVNPGSGAERKFPPEEVRVAAIMAVLVTEGEMSPAKASEAARNGGRLAEGVQVAVFRDELSL